MKFTSFLLTCVENAHKFVLDVEHKSDLSKSFFTGINDEGFVLFRDRSFVECPYCHSLCYFFNEATMTTEVLYRPDEQAKRNQS